MLPKKDTPLPDELLELPLFHRIKVEDTPEDKQQEHYENFGFFIKDGKYYTQGKAEKGKVIKLRISNFVMKFLYHFDNGTNNTIRLVYLYQKTEREGENPAVEESIIEVYSSELKKETFETTLKSKGCTYYGQVYTFQRILEYLMMHEKKAILMDQIGWSAEHKVFVFADAVYFEGQIHRIEELGVVDVGSVLFYLPAFSYANRKNDTYQKDRLYSYRAGKTDFLTWAGLFYQSYGKNGAIGTIYTIAAIFRDIIFNQAGFFPYLFSFGEAGTGKTSFAEIILSLFGKDILGKPINSTNVGLTREAAHTVNMMLYFKEYSSEASEAVQDFLLTTYDGSGRTTGIKSNDTRTKTYNPRSAILLDGNHMPTQRSATMSRMILLNFESARWIEEESMTHKQILDLAKDGFGNVLKEV